MAFNFTSLIPGVGEHYEHIATAGIVTAGIVAMSVAARVTLGKGEAAAVPSGKVSIKGVFELLTEFIAGLVEMVIGEDAKDYVPMFASIFTFILINNLVGILPGMSPATENLNTTIAMGIFIFVMYNFYGVKEHGLAYLKHFLGPVLWLSPLMLIIEIVSHLVRPISLGLRLGSVMQGDHTVAGVFLEKAPFLVPIPIYLLGIFICFIQAYVFTLLSMVYVAMATAHEEH